MNQFILPYSGVWGDLPAKNFYLLIFLFFWASALWKNGGLKSHLPLFYRIQNICLSFFLVIPASLSVQLIAWCLVHPGSVPKYFYVQTGILPPAASLLILLLSFVGIVLEVHLGFLMVQQRQRARTLGLRLLPYLAAIELLNTMRVLSKHSGDKNFIIVAVVMLLLAFAPYVWLYFFFRSKQTEAAMTNVP